MPEAVRTRALPLLSDPYYRLFPERAPGAPADGSGFGAGDDHYRAYVGPPEDYDLIAGVQFGLLLAAGLREHHHLLDVGCGSLRAGRLAIPYLGLGRYHGIEPNRHLVEEGLRREVGRDLKELRKPRFRYVDDFSATKFGVAFDFAIAQSIFSHTYRDLLLHGLTEIRRSLAPDGLLFATFVEGPETPGTGWLYPGCTTFELADVVGIATDAGLAAFAVDWPHPRQRWFVAGHVDRSDRASDIAATVQRPRLDAESPTT